MSWIFFAIIIIICILYIYSYYRYPQNTYIMQSHIRMLKPEILLEKQPLVIDDNNYDINVFKTKWFNINPSQNFILNANPNWYINKYKYIIIQAKFGPTDILICNPNNKDKNEDIPNKDLNTENNTTNDANDTNDANNMNVANDANTENNAIVEVQLSEGQILILPFKWLYLIDNSNVTCIGIHDYITYFLP